MDSFVWIKPVRIRVPETADNATVQKTDEGIVNGGLIFRQSRQSPGTRLVPGGERLIENGILASSIGACFLFEPVSYSSLFHKCLICLLVESLRG
jgi:hypothetical protein